VIKFKLIFSLLSRILYSSLGALSLLWSSESLANDVHLDFICNVVDEASISFLSNKIEISKVLVDKTSPIFRFSGNHLFILEIKPFIDRSDKSQMKTFLRREERMYERPIEFSQSTPYGSEYISGEYSFFIENLNDLNVEEGKKTLVNLKQQKSKDIWIYLLSCSKPTKTHLIERK